MTELKEEVKEEIKEPAKVEPKKEETLELKKELDFEIIDGVKYDKEIIKEARADGWRYKEAFKGGNNKYLAPDKFVERGQKLPAFLNKKLDERDNEIKSLKKLLEKNIKTQVIDRMDNLDEKLQEASEMGEMKKVASMTRKKVALEQELSDLEKQEKEKPKLPQVQQKPIAVLNWELKNEWSEDANHPKTIKANEILNKIRRRFPNLSIKEQLKLIDKNLKDYEETNKQKKNLTAPIGQTKTTLPTGKITRKASNLKPAIKKQYEEHCVGNDGKKFKGKALELYTESFLNACENSHFKI